MAFQILKHFPWVLHLGGAVALAAAASKAAAIQCTYSVSNDWGSGFTANITVTNNSSSPISSGWEVRWLQNNGSKIISSWNATLSGSNPYIASNVDWNAYIAPGASQSFGVQGDGDNSTATIQGCSIKGSVASSQQSSVVSSPASSSKSSVSSSRSSSSTSSSIADSTEVLIEENTTGFCGADGSIDSNASGFTGTGFVNTDNEVGAGINWKVKVSSDENYLLEFRYSNASATNRIGRLVVNGTALAAIDFSSTGAWSSWTITSANVRLKAGENTLRLEATTAEGLGNIDSISVIGNNPQPVNCGAVSNSSSSSISSSKISSSSLSSGVGIDGNYYVAVGGSDTNSGSISKPFATLQKAIDTAQPGQLVYVRGGVYRIKNPAIPSAGVNFWKGGTSDQNRIRYFAFPGEHPVLDFAGLLIQPDPNYTAGVYVSGAYLHLKGFEIRNVPMNTRSNTGLSVGGGAHHDIFEALDIHHNAGAGMFINTTTGGHLVLNSDAHDNYDPYSHQGDGQNADGFGVHYQKSGDSTIFRGCRAWWNSDDGWDFISQEVPVIVENSWSMSNGYINSGTARPADGSGAGFKIGSTKTGTRHIIRNNLAWGNRNQGFYANHSSGGSDWFNNTSYHNGVQFDMLASTWDSDGNRTDGVTLAGDKVHRMRNNIGFPNENKNMNGVDTRSNTWDLGIIPISGDFVSVSDEGARGARSADGGLPKLDFLRLQRTGQMVDKGMNVGLPYTGAAPDLGAYEH